MSESSKDIKQVKAVGVGKGQLSQGGQGRRLCHLSHVKRQRVIPCRGTACAKALRCLGGTQGGSL